MNKIIPKHRMDINGSIERREWTGCYREGWQQTLSPHAYQHPAKVSFGLASRLYRHMLERGYIRPGDTVLDPFAGVGGFAFHALTHGLHFVGVELEARFVTLAQGMDCPGLDAAFWRRYQGRGRKWHDLGICPDCGDALDAGNKALPLLHWFGTWRRAVPHVRPHRYQGNIERWQALGLPGTARVVQGDSRRLLAVLQGADCAVSSPPYAGAVNGMGGPIDFTKTKRDGDVSHQKHGMADHGFTYGRSPGQLGAMPEGDVDAVLDAAIGSPPYASGEKGHPSLGSVNKDAWGTDGRDIAGRRGVNGEYGKAPGQLAELPEGDLDAAISSPAYGDTVDGSGEGPGARHDFVHHAPDNATKSSSNNGYGRTPGNLGNMPGYDAAVSSPAYGDAISSTGHGLDLSKSPTKHGHNHWHKNVSLDGLGANYGSTPGNIGNDSGDTFWQAARVILEQTFAALKPGGVAAFITGDFVRDGRRVEFGRQWLALCEAVGFVPLEHIVAWKREPGPVQLALVGEDRDHTVDRVSFFRRLANQNNPEAAVLNEDVWIVRRPGEQNQ